MTCYNPALSTALKGFIPISRFNRGEASKIFEEVEQNGLGVVLKNNAPVGIIISPEMYAALLEELEDNALLLEAKERVSSMTTENVYSQEQMMEHFGIQNDELESIDDVEIG